MEEEMEFSEYLNIIKANWWLILIVFAVVVGAAYAYTILTPPTYDSTSMVMIKSQDQTTLLLGGALPKADINTQAQIMQSSDVLSQVKNRLPKDEFEIVVTPIKDTNVIEITAEATNPVVAMMAANFAADAFINYSIESRRQDALDVIEFITMQAEDIRAEVNALNGDLIKYSNLRRNLTNAEKQEQQSIIQQVNAKDKLYNTLISRREEVAILSREDYGNIRVIQTAEFPLEPSKPNMLLNMALGVVLGLMLGLGAAFMREQAANVYRSNTEIEKLFGPIILESIPYCKMKKGSVTEPAGNKKAHRFLEAVRMLRTNLLFLVEDKGKKIICLTSPSPKSGKTIVAANLGIALANAGEKVLLVDANFRDNMLSREFLSEAAETRRGLSDLIISRGKPEEHIAKTTFTNLSIMPLGQKNDSPAELFSSNSMKQVTDKLSKLDYSVVIFDGASMEYAESGLLAAACHGAIMVVSKGKSKKEGTEKAKKQLEKLKVAIAGVIVTNE